jgi:hypothetical protein
MSLLFNSDINFSIHKGADPCQKLSSINITQSLTFVNLWSNHHLPYQNVAVIFFVLVMFGILFAVVHRHTVTV